MPCRSAAPLVEIRKPAAARCPTTVGPVQPGARVHGDPDGLVDDHDRVVVVDDLDALDGLGHDRDRVDRGAGSPRRASSPAPPGRTWPARDAVDADVTADDQLGRPGAGQAEHPGDGGVDALAGQPVGDRAPCAARDR